MKNKLRLGSILILILILMSFCKRPDTPEAGSGSAFTGAQGEVKLMTVDPGHFHAALVQKTMPMQIHPTVYIYAPDGPDIKDHLERINGFNTRAENPTNWESIVYTGDDFLEKMVNDKPGNVMVVSGNNRKKTEYILTAVENGIHVLADKPMAIDRGDFDILLQAFETAGRNNVMIYDIMTERYEITTILQKLLSMNPEVFGELLKGTPDEPAVTKESVHHFFKYVSGNKIVRPPWFFDVSQQGEGLVDVTTHLVDLIQWECFPDKIIDYKTDIRLHSARRWPTPVTPEQFAEVTGLTAYPEYLKKDLGPDGILQVYANGEMIYQIKDVYAKVSVEWKYVAPEGAGDTHFSVMRGKKADLVIRQGIEQQFKPVLYIEPSTEIEPATYEASLYHALEEICEQYPGITLLKGENGWEVRIPEKYRIGHEAHFGQVTEKFLHYLADGALPGWEVPNMIARYYLTTKALEMARKND